MMKTPPAWQEILLLNYRERLAAALSEMDMKTALELALRDTALDVAGSGSIAEPAEMGGSLLNLPRRRRRRRPPPSL